MAGRARTHSLPLRAYSTDSTHSIGSFLEFLPILSLLSARYTASDLPYHLVVPSLPGYAFSSPPPLDRDFRLEDIARLFNKLMIGLGFESGYVVQGGDVGSKVARVMAAEQANCKGLDASLPSASYSLYD